MAGTGLPTGGNRPPVLLDPSPLVQPDSSAAQAWGALRQTADEATRDFGRMAAQAEHASQLKWAADFELEARGKRIELQTQFADDPENFKREWQAFTDGKLGAVPLKYADHARHTLGKEGLSSLASIEEAHLTKTKALAADAVKARLGAAQTDVLGYAYRGEVNGEKAAQAMLDFRAYLNDGVRAGLWSQEHADLKVDELAGKAKAESIVGMSRRLFDQKGLEGGYAEAENLLSDPALKLDPREVEQYRGRISAEMNKWAGFQTADRQRLAVEADILKDKFKVGAATEDEVTGLVQRAVAVRDYKTASDLTRGYARQETLANEAWKPPADTAQTIRTLQDKARSTPANTIAVAPDDREALIRIALAEAGNQGTDGLSGVIYTVLNRTRHPGWGGSVSDVINAKNQFEPVVRAGGDWKNLPAGTEQQRAEVGRLIEEISAGQRPDPTGGATYFLNRRISAERGTDFGAGKDQFKAAEIGDHTFYRPGLFGETATPVPGYTVRLGVDPDMIRDLEAANARKGEMLEKDPMGYFYGLPGAPPMPRIDWSRPDSPETKAALEKATYHSSVVSATFGRPPVSALTKAQSDEMAAAYKTMDAGRRAQLLGLLGRAIDPDRLAATTEKIAGDLPSLSWAANLYQINQDAAIAVVSGESALEHTPGAAPSDSSKFRRAVDAKLGTAMNNPFGPLESREAMARAARAHYVAAKVAAGDTSGDLDTDQLDKSIDAVTGNVITYRGQKLIAPQYGMTSSGFSDVMDSLTQEDLPGAYIRTHDKGTRPVTPLDVQQLGTLFDRGGGQYSIVLNGAVTVFGQDGMPLVLDLSKKKATPWADRPLMDDAQRERERQAREDVSYLRQVQQVE
ncbi:hypothetical protein GAY31_17465 [Azospirillum brasilense]|nr:hypothetical protein [Azospirillum brasilense]